MADTQLYKIGELSSLSKLSARTIDYYTRIGLIREAQRSTTNNYRLYDSETLKQLERIERWKREKYSLEDIKRMSRDLQRVSKNEEVVDRLTDVQLHLQQLEKDLRELGPLFDQLKPNQARHLQRLLTPQSAAVIEALLLFVGNGKMM